MLETVESANETGQSKMASKSFSSRLQMETTVNLEWRNIDYRMMVKSPKSTLLNKVYDHKQILSNINGIAKSGELLAIMGPTGCGKTSLLNVLAARAPMGSKDYTQLSGSILVNGKPLDDQTFRNLSAYVLQDDKLFPHLTIHETLMIAAHFYLATTFSFEEKELLVDDVIAELGLVKAKNTIIGDEKIRGVSGGERRRANIAVQLITNPSVLFLDEPTSGLDSFQAQSVMEAMKSMAENSRLVVSVIHQPRSSIYNMFDRLLLLSEGRTMYFGDTSAALDYFASAGFVTPANFNPSDFFLDILSPDNRTPELEESAKTRIQQLGDRWEAMVVASPQFVPFEDEVTEARRPLEVKKVVDNFKILCWRSFAEQSRDKTTLTVKVVVSTLFGLLIGGIYSGTQHNQQGIQNRTGLLFLIVINQTFNPMFAVINVFPKEKIIVYRERSAKAYETLSYFTAKFFVEIPLNMMPTLLFSILVFWLAGLNPKTFGYFLLIMGLHNICAITLGLFIGSLAPTVEAAAALGTPIVIIMVLFGGFYINVDALPIVANWVPYLSPLRWTFQALCVNEFVGLEFGCTDVSSSVGCVTTGEEVLEKLGFAHQTPQPSVFGLAMVLLGIMLLLFIMLEISRLTYMRLGYKGRKYPKDEVASSKKVSEELVEEADT